MPSMAWPLPPTAPGPATTDAPAARARPAVSSREPSSHDDLVDQAVPTCPLSSVRTTSTTGPTVDSSSRAGRHTETVPAPLRLDHGPAGKSPW